MNSLSTGAWGSFSAPCSRALGGKSGMTRAAPFVCFVLCHQRCPHQASPLNHEHSLMHRPPRAPDFRPSLLALVLLLILAAPWSTRVATVQPGFVDLSDVRLLRCGVDTVRQLYRGMIRPEIMALFEVPGVMVDFAGQRWHSGRVWRDSGYQFKLQNADLGIILLVKNFNAKLDCIGPHLKIEVSPHTIDSLSPERLQARLDFYAAQVLTHLEINQCAVHLALDLQGWTTHWLISRWVSTW